MKINARRMALKILNRIEIEHEFSHHALASFFQSYEVVAIDRRFISNIVLGVLEHKMLLDFYIRKFSKLRFGKINHEVVNILRIGMYQVLFMDKVPESAAVNESVKMAKRISGSQGNYVNGVLRSFVREYETIAFPDPIKHLDEYLSIKYSHPKWMINMWLEHYGRDFTEDLLKANNLIPPLSLRINTSKITREEYGELLRAKGVDFTLSELVSVGISVLNLNQLAVEDLPGYQEGWFQVQDISSMKVTEVSGVKEGDFVIDVCAAPGGKACHMAEILKGTGKVLARDLHEHKCEIVRENAKRMKLTNLVTETYDATHFDKTLKEKADVVLVDAPCSGLGIIRRKPDIKYNKQLEDLTSLEAIQTKILNVTSQYVKINGFLIYSTCTLNPLENEVQIRRFLKHNQQFELVNLSETSEMLTLFPNVEGTDGFFIAKLKRIK